jgi:hypothetical protein
MPEILIQPDNRLLGWPTNDLSLYGAQMEPGVRIGPAASPTVSDTAESSARVSSGPAAEPAADPHPANAVSGSPSAAVPGDTPQSGSPALAPATVISYIPAERTAMPDEGVLPGGQPAPTAFIAPIPGPASPGDSAADPAPPHAPASPGVAASVLAPAEMANPLTASIADADASIAHVMAHAPVLPPLETAADEISELLDGMRGLDPAAGIGTIVDLMKTADIFELRAADGDILDHGVTPILDTLGIDALEAPSLLGENDLHHDGLLGGALDAIDAPHGLPGGL